MPRTPEIVAKLPHLSSSQRETINQQMLGLNNSRKIYENLVDSFLQRR